MKKYPILNAENLKGTVSMPVDDLREILIYLTGIGRTPHQHMTLRHLETAITSSEFLQYNLSIQGYESAPMQQCLEFVGNGMNRIRKVDEIFKDTRSELYDFDRNSGWWTVLDKIRTYFLSNSS